LNKLYTSLLFSFLICLDIQAQKNYVFVGSYNANKTKDGIYIYELDTLNGNLKPILTHKIFNPSFLTLSPNGKYLYACTESRTPNAGSVSSFEFDAEKQKLSYLNSQRSGGENPVFVKVHKSGKWLVNANYTQGSVSVYALEENGFIKSPVQVISYQDSSINKVRQERSHVHSANFSPNHDFVFLPDLGADKIRTYGFGTQQIKPLQETFPSYTKTTLGSGPRHFDFHPNGLFAYGIEEMAGFISVYKYSAGKLKSIQRIATHPDSLKSEFSAADIHISPDGKFLYASNRGEENNIAIFSIKRNGKLKSVGYQSTMGKTPRNFAIDDTGKFIIVANQSTGEIVVFRRDFKTGLLTKIGTETKIESPTCIKIRQY
jgi:6-phosphogluconolactonase